MSSQKDRGEQKSCLSIVLPTFLQALSVAPSPEAREQWSVQRGRKERKGEEKGKRRREEKKMVGKNENEKTIWQLPFELLWHFIFLSYHAIEENFYFIYILGAGRHILLLQQFCRLQHALV